MKSLYEKIRPHQLLFFVLDIIIVNGAYFLSMFLHRQFSFDYVIFRFLVMRIPVVTLVYVGLFVLRKLYNNLWKYMGLYEVINLSACATIATGLCWTIDSIGGYIVRVNNINILLCTYKK